ARDDSAARAAVAVRRRQRAIEHAEAVREVFAAEPGTRLSPAAARVAMASLMSAIRTGVTGRAGDRRTASCDGLACNLFHTGTGTGVLAAPTWRVLLPGRVAVFHPSGVWPVAPVATRRDHAPRAVAGLDEAIEGAAG